MTMHVPRKALKKTTKPLNRQAYGSIPHLPGSNRGPGDRGCNDGQLRACTERATKPSQRVIVQEKLDGSNVAVARVDGLLVPLVRAGYRACTSEYLQHHFFEWWVRNNEGLFDWLDEGWRCCGEWLAQAHGTRYALQHEPFVAFDVMREGRRLPYDQFIETVSGVPTVATVHTGAPLSIEAALDEVGEHGQHGAIDPIEGVVWRIEHDDRVVLVAKYVKPSSEPGRYLEGVSGKPAVWNWTPLDGSNP